jgi:hypothetical protein
MAAVAPVLVLFGIGWSTATAQTRPKSIDLRSQQTPLRNQGARTTRTTFAAVAALEAAYIREGIGSFDLSEQFLNHMGNTRERIRYATDGVRSLDGAFSVHPTKGGGT